MIRKILMSVAAVVATTLANTAFAQTVHPAIQAAEKAAPTVECRTPVEIEGKKYCFVNVRFPDGSLTSTATYIQGEKAHGSAKLLEGPLAGKKKPASTTK